MQIQDKVGLGQLPNKLRRHRYRRTPFRIASPARSRWHPGSVLPIRAIRGRRSSEALPPNPKPEISQTDLPEQLVAFEWNLESHTLIGEELHPHPQGEVSLRIAPSGRIEGNGGCNAYFAGYELGEEDHILIQRIGTTRMACGDPEGVMDQESQYLIALSQATFFAIDKERLTLFDRERNATLHFSAVE